MRLEVLISFSFLQRRKHSKRAILVQLTEQNHNTFVSICFFVLKNKIKKNKAMRQLFQNERADENPGIFYLTL